MASTCSTAPTPCTSTAVGGSQRCGKCGGHDVWEAVGCAGVPGIAGGPSVGGWHAHIKLGTCSPPKGLPLPNAHPDLHTLQTPADEHWTKVSIPERVVMKMVKRNFPARLPHPTPCLTTLGSRHGFCQLRMETMPVGRLCYPRIPTCLQVPAAITGRGSHIDPC